MQKRSVSVASVAFTTSLCAQYTIGQTAITDFYKEYFKILQDKQKMKYTKDIM